MNWLFASDAECRRRREPCLRWLVAVSLAMVLLASAAGAAAPMIAKPLGGITPDSYPLGIAAGPDGDLWFTEQSGRVAKITPAGVVSECRTGISADSGPEIGGGKQRDSDLGVGP